MNFFGYLALWGSLCFGRLTFQGFPRNETTTCFQPWNFDFSPYFVRSCTATDLCGQVTYQLSSDLREFGFRWDSDSTRIGGTSNELAALTSLDYTINTTVSAGDSDNTVSGILLINVICPLTIQGATPDLNPTSNRPFSFDLSPYVVNPLPSVPLVWSLQGLPTGSGYSVNNGTFSGTGSFSDTRYFEQARQISALVNYNRGPAANAATLPISLRVTPIGPNATQIPNQFLTENTPYRGSFASYFQDPDGNTLTYAINWPAILATVLTFDSTQAVITGTPTSAQVGSHEVSICASTTQAASSACSTFLMIVAPRIQSAPVCSYPSPLIRRTGDFVLLNVSAYCTSPSGAYPLIYTPDVPWHSPSGLVLNTSGLLSGVLIDNDATQSQPLRLPVRVTDADGLSTQVGLQITVNTINSPPRTTQYANIAQTAIERIYWEYSITPWFIDPDGDNLTYTITPFFDSRSAIRFNTQTGLFYGVPNSFDVSQRQYVWFLTAQDGRGGESNTATMTLTIIDGPNGPTTNPIPLVSPPAYLGVPWSFDIRPYFFDSDGDVLTFNISNPVAGSGLYISNGVLLANWTPQDVAASEFNAARVVITASDGKNGTVDNYVFYSVIVPPNCSVANISTALLTGSGSCPTPSYQLDISRFCTSNFPLTYALSNQAQRPANLNLTSYGVLAGPITSTDVQNGRIAVSVNATTSRGGSTAFTFYVPVQQPYALRQRSCDANQVQICYQGYGCTIQLQPCFVDAGLCYEIVDNTQSSLRVGANSGIVSGSVPDSDVAQPQPIYVTIRVRDSRGGTSDFRLAVRMLRASQIIFKPIPDLAPINCGDPCCPWNPADFIVNPTGNISYTWEYGLPLRSNITLNSQTGRFSGYGTYVDVLASPITLSIIVDSGLPTGPARLPPLTLTVLGKPAVTTVSTSPPFSTFVRVATPFYFDAKQLFRNVDSQTNYSITTPGLRSLTIDRSGIISGTVTSEEYRLNTSATSGIMTVVATVYANNVGSCGGGAAQASLLLLIDPQFGTPSAGGYPTQFAVCENTLLSANFGAYFVDPRQNNLSFTIQGLASNTSLAWNSAQGILKGIPNPSDFAISPRTVTVCAVNIVAATTCINFQLAFQRSRRPPMIDPPIPSPVTAVVGQSFSGFFSKHFSDVNNQPLIFSVSGLPVGSGLGIGPITGIFSGSPNEADFRASPLILTVFATNEQNNPPNNCSGTGGRARADFLLAVTKAYVSPTCNQITNPYDAPSVGQFWLLDVSRSVRDSQGLKLEYALRGLPRDSGLTIDPQHGILSGLITDADLRAQPLFISIAVTNGYGQCALQLRLDIKPRPAVAPKAVDCRSCAVGNGGCQHRCMESARQCAPSCSCNIGYVLQSDARGCSVGSSTGAPSFSVAVPGSSPCDYNNGGCSQLCANIQNVAVCSCRGTYALAADGRACNYDACSLNNGGCEQICVAGSAQCGCRQGMLNPDGRSCGKDIILVGTIPPALVLGCQTFMFDFATAFRYQGGSGSSLFFDISGLPQGTGFKIAASGLMSGTPTMSDCNQKQPMVVSVSASDNRGALARAVMFVSAFCQVSVCGNRPQQPTTALTSPIVPDVWATVGQRTRFDVSKYFPSNDLSFYCLGLPSSSGLWMSQNGVLDGIPTRQDCDNSLLGLTVVGRDRQAREYKTILSIKFNSCQSARDLWPGQFPDQFQRSSTLPYSPSVSSDVQNAPFKVQIPSVVQSQSQSMWPQQQSQYPASMTNTQTSQLSVSFPSFAGSSPAMSSSSASFAPASFAAGASSRASYSPLPFSTFERSFAEDTSNMNIQARAQCGKPFFYNVKDVFPVNGLSFSVDGLPSNTGFRMSDGGVLTGSPNLIDKTKSPLTAKVTAVDAYGSFKTVTVRINVTGFCADPSALPKLILPTQYAIAGQPFLLDLSRISFTGCLNASYGMTGLSSSSGLKMSSAGLLSGTPKNDECQSFTLRVTTTCTEQQDKESAFQIVISCPNSSPSALILNGQLPPASGISGQFFYYNVAPYLSSPSGYVNFSIASTSKNLVMSSNGGLFGNPTEADAGVISIIAVDARGTRLQADLSFRTIPRTNSSTLTFFPMKAIQAFEGNSLSLDFSQRFFPRNTDTVYEIQGLRPNSGLSLDAKTGMLSGIPNEADVRQTQPMRLIVIATLGLAQSSRGVVSVTVVPSTPLLAPKGYSSGVRGSSLVSMPIPYQIAGQNEPFLLGVSSSFFDLTGAALTYSLSGLVVGSGLTIDSSNGVISGNPTRADAKASQPLELTVLVTNSNGEQVSERFRLTVFQSKQQLQNKAPIASVISNAETVVGQDFVLSLSQYFTDPDGDTLTFSLMGLSTKSGLKIDSISGTISGQATVVDAKMSPIKLSILADDGLGGKVQQSLNLSVYQRARGATNDIPMSSTMPRMTVSVGEHLSFSARDYFSDSNGDGLSFRAFGLPAETGLVFSSKTGKLTGAPNAADAQVKQPLVVGFEADDGHGGRIGNILYLNVKTGVQYRSFEVPDDVLVNISATSAAPAVVMQLGVWTMFQTSRFFPFYQSSNKVTYIIAGLPLSAGLKFDEITGVMSGFPTGGSGLAPSVPVSVSAQYYYNSSLVNTIEQPLLLQFTSGSEQKRNLPPVARSIPDYRVDASEHLLINVDSSFSDPDGDALTFSISGLPPNSGLMIVPSSGMLFGSPSTADIQAETMLLTVIAEDNHGHRTQESFYLTLVTDDQIVVQRSSTASLKTCEDLGWSLVAPAAICAQSPKFSLECSTFVNYTQAQTLCNSLGARLCSSSELSDPRSMTTSTECTTKASSNDFPVWTSSTCAFSGTVVVQTGLEKNCSLASSISAKVKCCADGKNEHLKPLKGSKRFPPSVKSCENLKQFAIAPSSSNTAVCQYAPREGGKCTNSANFTEAKQICEEMGARLCTSTEITQDVIADAGCGVRGRVWTGVPCGSSLTSGEQSYTQGGVSMIMKSFPPQCTKWTENFPFVCCADFAPSSAFATTNTLIADRTLTLEWEWKAYSKVSVSYHLKTSKQWQGSQEVELHQGRGSFTINNIQPLSEYTLRITPIIGRKLFPKQAVSVNVNTTNSID